LNNGASKSRAARFVAVTTSIRREDDTNRVGLSTSYLQALKNAGLVPILLPPVYDKSNSRETLDLVDGLLLTGGGDVDPEYYGSAPKHDLRGLSRARDESEIALIHAAKEMHIPTLAICRGIQVMNVAFGGTLVQEIGKDWPGALAHDGSTRTSRTHPVTLEPDSLIARAVGSTDFEVNSLHHQSIDRLADELRITGRAPDGIVEAAESTDPDWWALAVQWHPEDLVDEPQSPDRGIFSAFAEQINSK
jgi:putative glutamine amidotransferase